MNIIGIVESFGDTRIVMMYHTNEQKEKTLEKLNESMWKEKNEIDLIKIKNNVQVNQYSHEIELEDGTHIQYNSWQGRTYPANYQPVYKSKTKRVSTQFKSYDLIGFYDTTINVSL